MLSEILTRKLVKNYKDIENEKTRNSYIYVGGLVGIVCNVILTVVKITVGIISGSVSILADGFNNLSDMASSLITMIGMKLAIDQQIKNIPLVMGELNIYLLLW